MSPAPLRLVPLDASHERATFDSGSAPLDRYLREQVTQELAREVLSYLRKARLNPELRFEGGTGT